MTAFDNAVDTASENAFQEAFVRLMSRAPGPVFPRARRLYFDKYPLETPEQATAFRTHLLEETIEEGADGSLHIEAQVFALVPWDPERGEAKAPTAVDPSDGVHYLESQWQTSVTAITAVTGPWFRTNSPYLRVDLKAVYCSGPGLGTSLSRGGS